MSGKLIKFPKRGKATETPSDERWKDAIACLQEAIEDIKKEKRAPDWLFIGMGDNFERSFNSEGRGSVVSPETSFYSMGMNTMELVGFLTMYINALLRGEFS